jgi:(E)-4-hydroxy-3-methylbut-2-enyl-diphosphate synthase
MTFAISRNKTRNITIGSVQVGGNAPISVQSMTNTKTDDVSATVQQIHRLERAGCEIIRVAVPDEEAAHAIGAIKRHISIPLVADIHFDFRLALAAVKAGADALRINPGNIGGKKKVAEVVACAKDNGIPIRIGVNAGSLEKTLLQKYGGVTAEAMVESAFGHLDQLLAHNFDQIKISLKASDVKRTVAAYRLLAGQCDYPLHVGITEAGSLYTGIVKSALGIGLLLAEGIGDTIRVSLTRDPAEEVRVGYEILKSLAIRQRGPEIISCPTCGRCDLDLVAMVDQIDKALAAIKTPVKLAVMGCVVNGPGEAKEADIGIAGGKGIGILFKKGKIVKKVPQNELLQTLITEVQKFTGELPVSSPPDI